MLGNLIMGFIAIIIGVTLAPTVADQVFIARHEDNASGNISGASYTIMGLTTLFYVLGVAAAGISIAAQGLRASGLI